MDNVKSKVLDSLDSETQALVRVMESRVESVWPYNEVILDISSLIGYSGQGKCREVRWKTDIRGTNTSRNWTVTCDDYQNFCIIDS